MDRDFLDSCFWLYSNSFPCLELHYSSLLVKLRKTIKTLSNFILLQYLPTFQRRPEDAVVITSIPRSRRYVWFGSTMLRSDCDVCIHDIWHRGKHNLVVYISPSLRAHISSTWSPNMNSLKIWQQKVENVKSIIVGHLNVNSIRSKFVLTKNAMKTFDVFLL